jgi:hypothetical protein
MGGARMIRNFCFCCQRPAKLKRGEAVCKECSGKLDMELRQPMNEAMQLERALVSR